MATTHADRWNYDVRESPESAIKQIQSERRRKGIIAAALFAVAVAAGLGFVYLAYNDVPAPSDPANSNAARVRPYQ
jgi:hypothetical protein